MKRSTQVFIAGIFISISGSIFASSTAIPFVFSSGQKAKASEINSNFSSLASTIDQIEGRVTSIESEKVNTNSEVIPITQIDLPVGSKITVGGRQYTIVQFEFPRYQTDEPYIIKYPVEGNFETGTASASIQVSGTYPEDSITYPAKKTTSIGEFGATIDEHFYYTTNLTSAGSGRTTSSYFYHYLSLNILVDPETNIYLTLSSPRIPSNTSSSTISADASDIASAYPTTKKALDRAAIKADLRALLSYIVVKKNA